MAVKPPEENVNRKLCESIAECLRDGERFDMSLSIAHNYASTKIPVAAILLEQMIVKTRELSEALTRLQRAL